MDAIYDLKEMLCEELEEYGKKDKLDVGGLEIVDKLAHTIKNLDKIIETYEEEDEEYSGAYANGEGGGGGGSYARGRRYSREGRGGGGGGGGTSRRGGSYARQGRRGNVRRDSMGRYSRDAQMIIPELRDLMEDATDERTRMELMRFIQRIESM